jgi:hypothetical protein
MTDKNIKKERSSKINHNTHSNPKSIMIIDECIFYLFGKFVKEIKNINEK